MPNTTPDPNTQQTDKSLLTPTELELKLAHAWLRQGRWQQAIPRLQKLLAIDPELEAAYIDLAEVYTNLHRWNSVISICEQALVYFPNQSVLHKHYINAFIESAGWNAACLTYGLERLDSNFYELASGDIACCLVVRNESLRLPWFLSYYRRMGVSQFLVVDNGSTDGTVNYLLEHPDVKLWQSKMSFNSANFGSAWFELLLRKYGLNRWCLTVDADELITFSGDEEHDLVDLCAELECQGKRAASGILLDMVSDKALSETVYQPGEDFQSICPYFDRTFFHQKYEAGSPFRNQDYYYGGLRQRVFGSKVGCLLTKTPLLKYQQDTVLAGGQHWTNIPTEQIAHQQICVKHFKYFSSFADYAKQEARREEHSRGAEQYKLYAEGLSEKGDLILYDVDESVEYTGTRQLIDLGIMRAGLDPSKPTLS